MMKPPGGPPDSSGRDPLIKDAGQKLKRVRESLNLRYRDVEEASLQIAARHKNDEFAVALSRLSDIENKGTLPSIYRLYTLCAIYHLDLFEVLEWYHIEFSSIGLDANSVEIDRSHLVGFNADHNASVMVPLTLDPGIDLRRTVFLSRVIQRWGKLPLMLLNGFDLKAHRYGFVGTDDWFMYPLIQPGSLLLIDESRRKISASGWSNEFDRPIYFIERRDKGYACGWCSVQGEQLLLHPHPGSQCSPEILNVDEVDIIGQVTGVAMRLHPARRRHNHS